MINAVCDHYVILYAAKHLREKAFTFRVESGYSPETFAVDLIRAQFMGKDS